MSISPRPTVFAAVVLAGFAGPSAAENLIGYWDAGPYVPGGVITDVLVPTTSTDAVYVQIPGGLHRLQGDVWTGIELPFPFGEGIRRTLLVPGADDQIVVVGSLQRVYRTDDGGQSWRRLEQGLPTPVLINTNPRYLHLAAPPGVPGILYSALGQRLFKSVDGGATWAHLPLPDTTSIQGLGASEGPTHVVYAETLLNLYRSEDGGVSWVSLGNPPGSGGGLRLSPFDPDHLARTAGLGAYFSFDGGVAWTPVERPDHTLVNATFATFDPVDPDTLYVAGFDRLWRSRDRGTTWHDVAYGDDRVTVFDLEIRGSAPGLVGARDWLVGTGAGLRISADGGTSFVARDAGLDGLVGQGIVVDPAHPERIVSGTDSAGVFRSDDGGRTWTAKNEGLASREIYRLVAAPSDPDVLYAAICSDARIQAGGVFVSRNAGDTWTRTSLDAYCVESLAVDPRDPETAYAGSQGFGPEIGDAGGVFRTRDGGQTWEALVTPDSDLGGEQPFGDLFEIFDLHVGPGGALWAAMLRLRLPFTGGPIQYFGEVLRAEPDGSGWEVVDGSQREPGVSRELPYNLDSTGDAVLAGWLNRQEATNLLRTRDQGRSWQPVGGVLEGRNPWVLHADPRTGRVHLQTTRQVADGPSLYVSHDAGDSWHAIETEGSAKTLYQDSLSIGAEDAGAPQGRGPTIFSTRRGGIQTYDGCLPTSERACPQGRFATEVSFGLSPNGPFRPGYTFRHSRESSWFHFGQPDNPEVLFKDLNACRLNGQHWQFVAGMTNLVVDGSVTDVANGETWTFGTNDRRPFPTQLDLEAASCLAGDLEALSALGSSALAGATLGSGPATQQLRTPDEVNLAFGAPRLADRQRLLARLEATDLVGEGLAQRSFAPGAPDAASHPDEASCPEDALCLLGGRFQVTATWAAGGETRPARPVPAGDRGGFFWFLRERNLELAVKTLDGCALPGNRFWVLLTGATNLEVAVTVTDTESGVSREYRNPEGRTFEPVLDTRVFACP